MRKAIPNCTWLVLSVLAIIFTLPCTFAVYKCICSFMLKCSIARSMDGEAADESCLVFDSIYFYEPMLVWIDAAAHGKVVPARRRIASLRRTRRARKWDICDSWGFTRELTLKKCGGLCAVTSMHVAQHNFKEVCRAELGPITFNIYERRNWIPISKVCKCCVLCRCEFGAFRLSWGVFVMHPTRE